MDSQSQYTTDSTYTFLDLYYTCTHTHRARWSQKPTFICLKVGQISALIDLWKYVNNTSPGKIILETQYLYTADKYLNTKSFDVNKKRSL